MCQRSVKRRNTIGQSRLKSLKEDTPVDYMYGVVYQSETNSYVFKSKVGGQMVGGGGGSGTTSSSP